MKATLKVEYLMIIVYQTYIPEGEMHLEFFDVHFCCVSNYNRDMTKLYSTELSEMEVKLLIQNGIWEEEIE